MRSALSRLLRCPDGFSAKQIDDAVLAPYAGAFLKTIAAVLTPLSARTCSSLARADLRVQGYGASADAPAFVLRRAATPGSGRIMILCRNVGDTGMAALEGFKNKPGVKIARFSTPSRASANAEPADGVAGRVNVAVLRSGQLRQRAGRSAHFTDRLKKRSPRGNCFVSANSINWGRLVR
jgi:hypothetical protein